MILQFPFPPPSPAVDFPGPIEQAFDFCVVFLLMLSVGLLLLPQNLARRIVQIAFHLRGSRMVTTGATPCYKAPSSLELSPELSKRSNKQ